MSKEIKVEEIKLKIGEYVLFLTPDEARELYNKLGEVINTTHYYYPTCYSYCEDNGSTYKYKITCDYSLATTSTPTKHTYLSNHPNFDVLYEGRPITCSG